MTLVPATPTEILGRVFGLDDEAWLRGFKIGQQLHINGIDGQLIRELHEVRLITNGLLEKLPDTLYGGAGDNIGTFFKQ